MDISRTPHAVAPEKMQAMLCTASSYGIRYTQGLHEVLAAFLLAQGGATDDEVFAMFVVFVRTHAPFFHTEDLLEPLQPVLSLLDRLVYFHRPDMQRHLVQSRVTPDVYALHWFLTVFAHSSSDTRMTLKLWDKLLRRGCSPAALRSPRRSKQLRRRRVLSNEKHQWPNGATCCHQTHLPAI
ncbi:TBCK [Symbiodinium sp. CCMP2456]|nr:TBCK [Symbiodinium sp. CCMP2456]